MNVHIFATQSASCTRCGQVYFMNYNASPLPMIIEQGDPILKSRKK